MIGQLGNTIVNGPFLLAELMHVQLLNENIILQYIKKLKLYEIMCLWDFL